jgi:hypothetical protein
MNDEKSSLGIRNVQVRLTDEEYNLLKKKADLENLKLQPFVRRLILQSSQHAEPGNKKSFECSREHFPWHEKLEFVLKRGTDRDRTGIEQNLTWAVASIQTANPVSPARRKTGS